MEGKIFIQMSDGLKVATVVDYDEKDGVGAFESMRDATPAEERAYEQSTKAPSLIDSFRMGWRMTPEQYDEYAKTTAKEAEARKERRAQEKANKKQERLDAKEVRKKEKIEVKARKKAETKPSKFNPLNWFGKKEGVAA